MKTRFAIRFLTFLAVLALLAAPAWAGQALKVKILHVNDTHSHMEPYGGRLKVDGAKTYLKMGGMTMLPKLLDKARKDNPGLLLLHGGDAVQGTLYFTKFKGKPEVEFMNWMKFDAMAVGNHEFDKGPGLLASFIEHAKFPLLSANIDASADPSLKGKIKPYIIKDVAGGKVAIVGLTTVETPDISSPGDKVHFENTVKSIQAVIDKLTAQGIDKIIMLSHQGYKDDMALAAKLKGLDLIVGGHSHTLLGDKKALGAVGMRTSGDYPTVVKSASGEPVYVVQAWEHAKAVGDLDVAFDAKGVITNCSGKPILLVTGPYKQKNKEGKKIKLEGEKLNALMAKLNASPVVLATQPNKEAVAKLAPYKKGVEAMQKEVIGNVADDLPHLRIPGTHQSGKAMPKGSYIAPLVCEAMLWKANSVGMKVDMVMQNAGGVRVDIPAGKLTVGKVYSLLPFGNTLFVLKLTGAQIKSALGDGLAKAAHGGSGAFPYVAGARYQAKGDKLMKLEIKDASGKFQPVDDSKSYLVATNAFIASGGDGYKTLKAANAYRYDTGFIDAQTFIDYATMKKTLKAPADTGVDYKP